MSEKRIELPRIAESNIEQVLLDFLAEQRRRLKPQTLAKYRDIVELLQNHLNGYGYEALSKAESALFEKHFYADGDEHKEFCQIFGSEKIPPNLGMFFSYFMVSKVLAGPTLKRAAGTVTKKLVDWLVEKGRIPAEDALKSKKKAERAERVLPNAEKALAILFESAEKINVEPDDLDEGDYVDFDHHTIRRIGPGKLWFTIREGGLTLVPVTVPKEAADLLETGWDIRCAFARIRGKWHIIEVANVYPH